MYNQLLKMCGLTTHQSIEDDFERHKDFMIQGYFWC